MSFPYFQRQLSREHPDSNPYTLLGYCNWESLFLTLRFTFFIGSSAAFSVSKSTLSLFSLNYTSVCFRQLLESYLKTLSEHFEFTWAEVLLS